MTCADDGGALLLLRHGQSVSNAADVFTGWNDAPLSALGVTQARGAAAALRDLGVRPTSVHTSLLRRSIATAEIVTDGLSRGWIPVHVAGRRVGSASKLAAYPARRRPAQPVL